ncbi:ATP-binding cassette domain-containing protein [Actinoplanes sp. RD1]|uniref:ATP-binding cassette domain-containing protein n=1 Tax=Actinoplanes sp. RD1 TaxID=3064538 RepID=UPI0027414937|nr:ABC transporter ATP-binding protein [Actinoplanes sp. RD1]
MTAAGSYTRAELWRLRRPLAWMGGWSLAEAVPALLSGYATARAVDGGFLADRPAAGLAWLAVFALAVTLGAAGSRGACRRLGGVVEPFRDRLVIRVVTGAVRRSASAGRPDDGALARLTHQTELVRDALAGVLTVLRGVVIGLVAAVVGLLGLAPLLGAAVGVPLLLGLVLFFGLLPILAARQRAAVAAGEHLSTAAESVLSSHRDVTAAGAQQLANTLVGDPITEQARADLAVARGGALRGLALAVGGWAPLLAVLVVAPWLVRRGDIGPGAVLGALVYVRQGLHPALHLLVEGLAAGGLRYSVTLTHLLTASTVPAPAPPGQRDLATPGLRLREVTFRYGPAAAPVLDRFSLDVHPGERLVIAGASGIGKSTLAALMAGLLTPDEGTVTRCGPCVLLPQEAYVFSGTVAENLAYLRPAPDSALLEAVGVFGLGPLLERLGGLHAPVDPAALSAGERQLLALARAWLAPAGLTVLDEATCHLDPAAEERAERAFAARPRALVVIAHRMSSARRATRILLFDGARPELGTHAELLSRSAAYRRLADAGRRRSSDPAGRPGDVDGLDPVLRPGLGEDARQMVAHGAGGEGQVRRDVLDGEALRGDLEDA